jgi:hypothetical protein
MFKNREKELLERWPCLVHIGSVIPVLNADGIQYIEIRKKFPGKTLQELYTDHAYIGSGILVDVSTFLLWITFFFLPLFLIYFS